MFLPLLPPWNPTDRRPLISTAVLLLLLPVSVLADPCETRTLPAEAGVAAGAVAEERETEEPSATRMNAAGSAVRSPAALRAALQPPRGTRRGYPAAPPPGSGREPGFAIGLHSGFRVLGMDSGLFDDNEYDFGIAEGDFLATRYGFEFDVRVFSRTSLVIGVETGSRDVWGSYTDLVFEDGAEIEHRASLSLTELTVGGRVRLGSRAARIQPYFTGGLATVLYRYSEIGDFVDFETYDIFYDEFSENQLLLGYFAAAGADFTVVRTRDGGILNLFGEFRYAASSGVHDDGFEGFGDFRLTRSGVLLGARFRF